MLEFYEKEGVLTALCESDGEGSDVEESEYGLGFGKKKSKIKLISNEEKL